MKKEILVGQDLNQERTIKILVNLLEHKIPYTLGSKKAGYRISKDVYTDEDTIVEHEYIAVKVRKKHYEQAKKIIFQFVSEDELELIRQQDIEKSKPLKYEYKRIKRKEILLSSFLGILILGYNIGVEEKIDALQISCAILCIIYMLYLLKKHFTELVKYRKSAFLTILSLILISLFIFIIGLASFSIYKVIQE